MGVIDVYIPHELRIYTYMLTKCVCIYADKVCMYMLIFYCGFTVLGAPQLDQDGNEVNVENESSSSRVR